MAKKVKKIEEVLPEQPEVIEQPIQEPEPVIEMPEVKEPEPVKEEPIPEPIKEEVQEEILTDEQKIVRFIDGAMGSEVRLNEFLKSLYPIPKFNEPGQYLQQGESRRLRQLLAQMQAGGLLTIKEDKHLQLGAFYYPDSSTGETKYHNLNSIIIFAKK